MTDQQLTGKTAVVTGAGRGLGLGIARQFADVGANVLMCDQEASVVDVAADLAGGDRTVVGVTADVTDPGQVDALYARADRDLGGVDISVQNAGTITIDKLEDTTLADFQRVLSVNVTGVFLCCQAAVSSMRRHGRGGRLVNAASGQSRQGFVYTPAYAASKFGVVGLTQSLAKELAREAITVNAYAPGIVGTEMWEYNDQKWGQLLGDYEPGGLMAEWVAGIPVGRVSTAEDVAKLVLFLASPAADYITGQTINVDGGMFMS